MKKFPTPMITTIMMLILLSLLTFHKNDLTYLLFFISIYIVITFHELGHMFFGLIKKAELHEIVVGPISYKTQKGFSMNKEWQKFGGLTIMKLNPNNKWQHIIYYAGGPFASFIFGIIFMFFKSDLSMLISVLSFGILIVTILPYNIQGLNSDGYIIYQYLRKNEKFIYFNSISSFLIYPFDKEINNKLLKKMTDFINEDNLSDQEEAIVFLYEMYNFVLFNKPFEFKNYRNYLVNMNPYSEIINSNIQILNYIGMKSNKKFKKNVNISFLDRITKNKFLLINCPKKDKNYYSDILKNELNTLKDTSSLTYKGESAIINLILLEKGKKHEI